MYFKFTIYVLFQFRTLGHYEAQHDDELSFNEDDILRECKVKYFKIYQYQLIIFWYHITFSNQFYPFYTVNFTWEIPSDSDTNVFMFVFVTFFSYVNPQTYNSNMCEPKKYILTATNYITFEISSTYVAAH